MKRIILSTLVLIAFSVTVFAQKKLKGKVFDAANNTPLSGASVNFGGKGGTTAID